MAVQTKLEALGGVMAYPGNAQVGSDVIDRAIGKTDVTHMNIDGVIVEYSGIRLGSNNTSKTKVALAKSD